MTILIKIQKGLVGFAEDKDEARQIRVKQVLPALVSKKKVIFDFGEVQYATQSYVHALIGEALKKYGAPVLKRIEFKNCSPQLRGLIELVVGYSLGGFPKELTKQDHV